MKNTEHQVLSYRYWDGCKDCRSVEAKNLEVFLLPVRLRKPMDYRLLFVPSWFEVVDITL
tara:strand:+ start:329 stop:508 length:180 start_codon:yes stop_codon:yes gene_type:complete